METRVKEILKKTELDFEVIQVPLTSTFKGNVIGASKVHLINSKTMQEIGIVGKNYGITQNEDIVKRVVEATDEIRQHSPLEVQMGGVIGNGKRIYLQLRIQGDSKVGNDTIKKYITILDSNDGSTSLSVGIGDFTMSCSNQFNMFYKNSMNKFRHSRAINERVDNEFVPLLLDRLSRSMQQVERYQLMEGTDISKQLVNDLMFNLLRTDKSYGSEESIKNIKESSVRGHGVLTMDDILNPSNLGGKSRQSFDALKFSLDNELNEKGNNLWGLHSGVTYWTTHMTPKKGITSSLSGGNYTKNAKSYEFAMNQLDIETPELLLK